jgi:hypothetical protein
MYYFYISVFVNFWYFHMFYIELIDNGQVVWGEGVVLQLHAQGVKHVLGGIVYMRTNGVVQDR